MRLAQISIDMLQKALEIYRSQAYPGQHLPINIIDSQVACLKELLEERFQNEHQYQEEVICHRYVVRLGNRKYKHMKLVIEEYLLEGEFFFAVDTHDQMCIPPESPGYEQWQALQQFNRHIKQSIEKRWQQANLPTIKDICRLVTSYPPALQHHNDLILVVDDEEDLVATMAAFLEHQGFQVITATSGTQAQQLISPHPPDLIIMDYLMPGMDGLQLCQHCKDMALTHGVPLILASATPLRADQIDRVDAFLHKPLMGTTLLNCIDNLLSSKASLLTFNSVEKPEV